MKGNRLTTTGERQVNAKKNLNQNFLIGRAGLLSLRLLPAKNHPLMKAVQYVGKTPKWILSGVDGWRCFRTLGKVEEFLTFAEEEELKEARANA